MNHWHQELQQQIVSVAQLEKILPLTEAERQMIGQIIERHPMCITPYYLSLIDPQDPNDPIRRIAIPNADEMNDTGNYDTSGEESNTILPGFQHKYSATALVLSTNICYMYCRFCFRKRMVGYTSDEINRRLKETLDYLQKNPQVNNVLITGGDSFTMSTEMIERYLEALTPIPHLDFIRFGTRVPVVLPQRILQDQALLTLLKHYSQKKQIVIVTHFNHPRELTDIAKEGIRALLEAGVVVRNQTVLLKGVNDDASTLAELTRGLTRVGVQPYYIFQCRPVKHVTGYQVPLIKGIELISEAKKQFNGVSKGFRYIMSHPRGKIEVIGCYENQFLFKFHQSKFVEDNERIFSLPIDQQATWLDLDLHLSTEAEE